MGRKKGRKQSKAPQSTVESEESSVNSKLQNEDTKKDEAQTSNSNFTSEQAFSSETLSFPSICPLQDNITTELNQTLTRSKNKKTLAIHSNMPQSPNFVVTSQSSKNIKSSVENSVCSNVSDRSVVANDVFSSNVIENAACSSKSTECGRNNNKSVKNSISEATNVSCMKYVEVDSHVGAKPIQSSTKNNRETNLYSNSRQGKVKDADKSDAVATRAREEPAINKQETTAKTVEKIQYSISFPTSGISRLVNAELTSESSSTTPVPKIPPLECSASIVPPIEIIPQPRIQTTLRGSGDDIPPSSNFQSNTKPNSSSTSNSNTKRAGFQIPTRVCHSSAGSKGRHIIVRTNHLSLNIQNLRTQTAVHYDVSIDPDKPKRLLRRVIEEFRMKHFPNRYPAYDGRKNLYAASPLPFNHSSEFSDTIKVLDCELMKEKEYKVVMKYATRVDLTSLATYMKSGTSLEAPQQAIQVLDIVLRCAPALWFVPVGRSYFTTPSGIVESLGGGYEMWYGLFQSVNLGWKPFVNVDVVHKGFPQAQSLIAALKEVCEDIRSPVNIRNGLSDIQLYKLKKFIVGLKIDYVLPNNPSSKRTYKVNNVAPLPHQLHFDLESAKHISVEEYYRNEKKVEIKYRNLPCLHVGSLKRQFPIYLPLEFCSITSGQVTQKKLSDRQNSCMIRKAATSTIDRTRKIKDALVRARFSTSPQVQEFGICVSEDFQEIQARVIDPPKLEYHNKESLLPYRGAWQPKQFLQGKHLDKWTVLVLDDRVQKDIAAKFVTQFISQGYKLGMSIKDPFLCRIMDSRKMKIELEAFFRDCFKVNCEIVIVILSEKAFEYSFVKQVAELTVGILTQCVKSTTILKKMDFATVQNILLKVNSKLNGVNHTLHGISRPKLFHKPIMIVGADVTHPSPDETKIPSVAAVCASHDPRAFQYNTQFRLQPPRMEIIQDLESIMRQHLLYFYHKTAQMKPLRILFYRDGVSEGQFQHVLDSELTAIRSACSKLERDYKPSITFLVVQKRHHTRLFPMNREDSDGKNCNVIPGTIVDSIITHPTERDFYLVSHTSIQGVVRPTKYHCLWDDNRLTEDELQEITYFLCYLFSRCTRSVSYPAPTYYAHLAAYRARAYLAGQNLETLSEERLNTQMHCDFQKKSPMYFI